MTEVVQDIVAEFEPESLSKLRQASQPEMLAGAGQPMETRQCEAGGLLNDGMCPPYIVEGVSHTHGPIAAGTTAASKRTLIPFQTVENMIQASAHAWMIGKPLLHHLTIRWPSKDWTHHRPVQDALVKWLSRNSGGAYFIWVKEGNNGPHSHFLLHLGELSAVHCKQVVRRTLTRLSGLKTLPKKAIKCTKPTSGKPTFESVKHRTAYLCKGGGPDVCEFLGIDKADWASVPDKQAGVSESLSKRAREREGGCVPSGSRNIIREMKAAAAAAKIWRASLKAEREQYDG